MFKSFFTLCLTAASASAINVEAAAKSNALALAQYTPTATSSLASSVLDLTYWKIQLPYSCTTSNGVTTYSFTSGSACEVLQTSLASLNNSELSVQTSAIDGSTTVVSLFTPILGVTTSGTTHPRTELRQMKFTDNTSNAGFGGTDNIYHYLEFSGTVVHLPAVAQMTVISQLFCGDSACSGSYLELQAYSQLYTAGSKKGLYIRLKNTDGTFTYTAIDKTWDVKTSYTFKFILYNSTLSVYYNGSYKTSLSINSAYTSLYYKVGNYCQSYVGYTLSGVTEDSTDYCLVYLTDLDVYDVSA